MNVRLDSTANYIESDEDLGNPLGDSSEGTYVDLGEFSDYVGAYLERYDGEGEILGVEIHVVAAGLSGAPLSLQPDLVNQIQGPITSFPYTFVSSAPSSPVPADGVAREMVWDAPLESVTAAEVLAAFGETPGLEIYAYGAPGWALRIFEAWVVLIVEDYIPTPWLRQLGRNHLAQFPNRTRQQGLRQFGIL